MSLRLSDLSGCFEGVIPSVVATVAEDGTPNISYLSHVVMVDEAHVALSNQFFTKTAANLRANPVATLLLVDGRDGRQFRLGLSFQHRMEEGPLFVRVAAQLAATSAQVGMAGVMRLRSVDVFRVEDIVECPSPEGDVPAPVAREPSLAEVAAVVERIAGESELTGVVDEILHGLNRYLGYRHVMVLLGPNGGVHGGAGAEGSGGTLTTIGSLGYERSGIGSEVTVGEGVIGMAAARGHTVKVSDMSRVRRYGAAVRQAGADEDRLRMIQLPGLADAMSQIAVPMMAHGSVQGVIFAESRERLAFGAVAEIGLAIVAHQAAQAVTLAEMLARETASGREPDAAEEPPEAAFQVDHHAFDDSVFIDGSYVIKGVAGRVLVHLLEAYLHQRRTDFSNREIRLARDLKLPDYKDNLETRLLLLQRRLDERAMPVRLLRQGRGQIRLVLKGQPVLRRLDR
ncbi:adenylate cyclase [Rhodopseudomonas julia]|uniref:Adenylate cyclase n=1 Tax=Rhodopseudomonas julia TaxID=200617 RepID=A0ABU0C7W7_9BRAD|nr:pyridoxamine 5'-phosphate oxidase family protein [Rhodopseudomonas julia]MDQ0326327.1 adenylate cyclase [Rhodopseudomonas julia]